MEKKKSKINTIILLLIIIVSMYFIFKLAIPIINKAQMNKAKLEEKNKETGAQIEELDK